MAKRFCYFGVEGLQPKPKGRLKSMSNFKRKKRKSDKPLATLIKLPRSLLNSTALSLNSKL